MPWPATWTEALRALLWSGAACLAGCGGGPVYDDAAGEAEIALPAFPSPERMIAVDFGPLASFAYSVDPESVSVNAGEVRYTLLARSASGAANVSYEGLRCFTRERRLYAFGRSDGSWSRARDSRWVDVDDGHSDRPRRMLAAYYFCPNRNTVGSVEEALGALRARGHPDADKSPR